MLSVTRTFRECSTGNFERAQVSCRLTNDAKLVVNRQQVWILPNFAMTCFGSQGRTRPWNPVELSRCRTAQSIYTCLSRSSTLSGTLILRPWPEVRVSNGVSPDLTREFREQEILNDDDVGKKVRYRLVLTVMIDTRSYPPTRKLRVSNIFPKGWMTRCAKNGSG